MAESAWLRMRQAYEALQQGRLEEAQERLREPLQQGYWRAYRIARKLARAYVVRTQRRLSCDEHDLAWHDLRQAEELHPSNPTLAELRKELTKRELRRFRRLLGRRELDKAEELLYRLLERQVPSGCLEPLFDLVRDYGRLLQHAQRGDFGPAWQQYQRLKVPEWFTAEYQKLGEELQRRQAQFDSALPRLLQAAQHNQHDQVILAAQEVLAVAPEHHQAQELRKQSWEALKNPTLPTEPPSVSAPTLPSGRSPSDNSRPTQTWGGGIPPCLLLWVDHVGSYLICLDNKVSIGGHGYDRVPMIPVCADLPRLHAEFCIDSEGFWLETSHSNVFLNGRRVQQRSELLQHGDRITLGETCELQFLRPQPLLQTAVVRITSGHRLPLAIEAVILMGQQVIFGWHPQAHIPLSRLSAKPAPPGDLCLCRSPEGLGVRVPDGEQFTIHCGDQVHMCRGWGLVSPGFRVEWTFCSFTLDTDRELRC